ncbi:MAG TPA: hypothetical protein VMR65_08900 [Candidatus Sulfotelmatobacter sp.]|jgi:hypothetical protein|nr:hypothetical protein [Candidatus Sulfotelmatobacter sp.]
MSIRKLVVLVICGLISLASAVAAPQDLQAGVSSISGNQITLAVTNPTGGDETARVRFTVRFDDGTTQTFTTPNLTVAAGATVTVTLAGANAISGITDGPEPIVP